MGPKRAEALARLGIETLEDLLLHLPIRYLDRTRTAGFAAARPGEEATLLARVVSCSSRRIRGGIPLVSAKLVDEEGGKGEAVWFRQPWLARSLQPGVAVLLSGRCRPSRPIVLVHPDLEILAGDGGLELEPREGVTILAVYPLVRGLTQRLLRGWIETALDRAGAPEPRDEDSALAEERDRLGLPRKARALRAVHRPASIEEAEAARRSLVWEEIFLLQLLLARLRAERSDRAPVVRVDDEGRRCALAVRAALPFRLTEDQAKAYAEIESDLAAERPMRRLLQGDVACGKTAVVALACAAIARSGGGAQAALLAPTELLAAQHAETLASLLSPAGLRVGRLVGGGPAAARRALLQEIAAGEIDVAVGTHALLSRGVAFRRLALVAVDEQHRFGVAQRLEMRRKGGSPHVLVLSATPIPRTLSLALHGDLDVTTIRSLPPGRVPVRTRIVPPAQRERMLRWIAARLRDGEQAFFVCPRIEGDAAALDASGSRAKDGEAGGPAADEREGAADTLDAVALHRSLLAHPAFRGIPIALLHGRIDSASRERVTAGLRDGTIRGVVATTVIEVGVDVPHASILVVQHPDRFGLAQLHQLRGRVGRSPGQDPYCFLMAGDLREETPAAQRLATLVGETDGFRIAEIDLRMRGSGRILGTDQTGVSPLSALLGRDMDLLEAAREGATRLLASDPRLASPSHERLAARVEQLLLRSRPYYETA
ncbi:MAG: ATP-dependent DNA helicase RecG [Candidatus Eisenbacteria bacterium]